MEKELFVFVRNHKNREICVVLKTKEQAQRLLDRPGGTPNYDLYRLVPVSLGEETVVSTKKVIV